MLATDRLAYDLPPELIATRPAAQRDSARMLVVSRSDPRRIEHRRISDLPAYLNAGDMLVLNRTKVLPARIHGVRRESGGRIDGLFLEELTTSDKSRDWRVLLRSNSSLQAGFIIDLATRCDDPAHVSLTLLEKCEGVWRVRVDDQQHKNAADETIRLDLTSLLERVGLTPLPPYILRARKSTNSAPSEQDDRLRYQTVYADPQAARSVAAPTAGLHFTPNLLRTLTEKGVEMGDVVLHVGAGTFTPVTAEYVEQHHMHAERYHIPAQTQTMLKTAKEHASRVIAIGTTTARAIESLSSRSLNDQPLHDLSGETDLLITPGRPWRHIDGLLTNFHLPRSTLLAMVAALFPGGVERLLEIYAVAIEQEYRFYSYGDAMLIMP